LAIPSSGEAFPRASPDAAALSSFASFDKNGAKNENFAVSPGFSAFILNTGGDAVIALEKCKARALRPRTHLLCSSKLMLCGVGDHNYD
jgi:hypothetical protein